jgi:predicted regulator of Ras-like GTPase activity (Roadblock/LC7/MglB family)
VLEFDDRLAVVRPLGSDGHLFVLATKTTNIGPLLFELRRQAPELESLL